MIRRLGDSGVTAVIGAIVVLALAGTAVLYINAFYVPRQGAAIETESVESTQASLLALASALSRGADAPLTHDVPLRSGAGDPPLLSGVVLSPARAEGALALNLTAPRISVSVVLDAPATGVPSGDPTRVDLGAGRMRHYLLGNATAGLAVGSLETAVGGAYASRAEYRLEAGALLSTREGRSLAIAPPALDVERVGHGTAVSWRIPLLGGAPGRAEGAGIAQVLLRPGPEAVVGGAYAYNMTIRVETAHLAAWTAALQESVGNLGFVNATQSGPADSGTVEALLVAPPGSPLDAKLVEAQLFAIRYETDVAQGYG